jgi:hypothetical protein
MGSVTFRIARNALRGRPACALFGLRANRSGIGLLPRMLPHKRAFEPESQGAPVFGTSRKSLLSPKARDVAL